MHDFTMVPNRLIRCGKAVSAPAKLVFLALKSCNPSHPSYSTIQEWTGLSRDSVWKAIKELVHAGMIEKQSGYAVRDNNDYAICDESEWLIGEPKKGPRLVRSPDLSPPVTSPPTVLDKSAHQTCTSPPTGLELDQLKRSRKRGQSDPESEARIRAMIRSVINGPSHSALSHSSV